MLLEGLSDGRQRLYPHSESYGRICRIRSKQDGLHDILRVPNGIRSELANLRQLSADGGSVDLAGCLHYGVGDEPRTVGTGLDGCRRDACRSELQGQSLGNKFKGALAR